MFQDPHFPDNKIKKSIQKIQPSVSDGLCVRGRTICARLRPPITSPCNQTVSDLKGL